MVLVLVVGFWLGWVVTLGVGLVTVLVGSWVVTIGGSWAGWRMVTLGLGVTFGWGLVVWKATCGPSHN